MLSHRLVSSHDDIIHPYKPKSMLFRKTRRVPLCSILGPALVFVRVCGDGKVPARFLIEQKHLRVDERATVSDMRSSFNGYVFTIAMRPCAARRGGRVIRRRRRPRHARTRVSRIERTQRRRLETCHLHTKRTRTQTRTSARRQHTVTSHARPTHKPMAPLPHLGIVPRRRVRIGHDERISDVGRSCKRLHRRKRHRGFVGCIYRRQCVAQHGFFPSGPFHVEQRFRNERGLVGDHVGDDVRFSDGVRDCAKGIEQWHRVSCRRALEMGVGGAVAILSRDAICNICNAQGQISRCDNTKYKN